MHLHDYITNDLSKFSLENNKGAEKHHSTKEIMRPKFSSMTTFTFICNQLVRKRTKDSFVFRFFVPCNVEFANVTILSYENFVKQAFKIISIQ